MTRKQIYQQIAAFLGKDWRKAREFEQVFFDNCLIPNRQITSLQLTFGKWSKVKDGEVIYYGENRDTLHLIYIGKHPSEKYQFSILR